MDGRTPLEIGLFEILKDIIDDEWGPYDDAHYWELVDRELPRMGLTREHSKATRNCSYILSVTSRTEAHIVNGRNQLHMGRWRRGPADQDSHVHDKGNSSEEK